jgi:hypothetical protein
MQLDYDCLFTVLGTEKETEVLINPFVNTYVNGMMEQLEGHRAVLPLYVTRLIKLVNKKGKQKSSLIFDEFPTIYLNNMDSLIATARSNKVATCLGVQDFSQLRKDYGKEQADVIMNITGNIVAGQVTGDTANNFQSGLARLCRTGKAYLLTGLIPLSVNLNNSKQQYHHKNIRLTFR